MKSFLMRYKKEVAMFAILIFGSFLILFRFTETPKVWVDEGVYTETARNFAMHGVLGLQTAPGEFYPINYLLSTGYPVIIPVAASLKVFGIGVFQARLPMVLYMFALMIVFFLYARRKYGWKPAIFSTLFLLSFAPFYGNGRPVQGEVPGLFFIVLGALFILKWEDGKFTSKKWAILSGLAFGLAAATKPIYLLGAGLAVLAALIIWFKKLDKKAMIMFLSGAAIPMIFWLWIQFPNLESLQKLVPLYLHIASTHADASLSTFQTVRNNLLKFFTESSPILLLALLAMTAFSFLWKYFPIKTFSFLLRESQEKRDFSISEFILLGFILLNFVGFLFGTGWYRYFFPANTLLYLLFPAAILGLGSLLKVEWLRKLVIVIPIGLLLFQFIHMVFLSETSLTQKRTRNSDLAGILSGIDPTKTVFFYGGVDSIIFFKGSDYSLYLSMADFLDTGNRDEVFDGKSDYILAGAGADTDFTLRCYDKKLVHGYYLYQKLDNCSK